jgi:hypothetical protein
MTLGPVGEKGTFGAIPAPAGVYLFESPTPGAITYQYRRMQIVPTLDPAVESERERGWNFKLKPLTPAQTATLGVGAVLLIILAILFSPVGL